jgi:hypothetical protein
VIDLARTLPFRSGVVVADSALHGFQTGQPELVNVVRDCARWPGIEKARRVVEFSDLLAESPFESIARVAFRDGGLPPPMLQVYITAAHRVIARVDFLWDEHATIAEADGALKYADPIAPGSDFGGMLIFDEPDTKWSISPGTSLCRRPSRLFSRYEWRLAAPRGCEGGSANRRTGPGGGPTRVIRANPDGPRRPARLWGRTPQSRRRRSLLT